MRKSIFILSVFALLFVRLQAQDSLRRNLPLQLVKDHGKLWSNAVAIQNMEYTTLIPVFSAAGLSMIFDEPIREGFVSLNDYQSINITGSHITHLGDPYVLGGATLLAYGSGWIFGDSKLRQTAIMMGEAYLHTGIFTMLGKWAFSRQRPFVNGNDRWHFFPYSLQGHPPSSTAYQSFPSGHTSGVFAVATVIAKQYQNRPWIPVTAYSLATLTGLSRITEQKHWLSDVIIGAALGYGIGNFVVKRNKNYTFTLLPVYWENNISLSMHLKF